MNPLKQADPDHLFLETTAQMLRLVGSPEMQRGINEIVTRSKRVGTSHFVLQECEVKFVGLYDALAKAFGSLLKQHRARRITALLQEIDDHLSKYSPWGRNMLFALIKQLNEKYRDSMVAPILVKNFLIGQKEVLMKCFVRGEVFDSSSCCVWKNSGVCDCKPVPDPECRLQDLAVMHRASFLESTKTLALARPQREESKWLRSNLDSIVRSRGMTLFEIIGKHPNHFGDLIIFWEVPEKWGILTRDRTFAVLANAHRMEMAVYYVRLPRIISNTRCYIERVDEPGRKIRGVLLNYTAKDARIKSVENLGKERGEVLISAKIFDEPRRGVIAVVRSEDHTYAIRLRPTELH